MGILLAHKLSPALADAILRSRVGAESQLTDRRKSPDAPNNLFKPSLARYAHIEGDFGAEARRRSLPTQILLSRGADGARWIERRVAAITARVFEAVWILSLPKAARKRLSRRVVAKRQRRASSG